MQEQYLFDPLPDDKIDELTPEEMKIIRKSSQLYVKKNYNYSM